MCRGVRLLERPFVRGREGRRLAVPGRARRRSSAHPPSPIPPRSNQPNVHEQRLLDNPDGWHGAELSVIIAGGLVAGLVAGLGAGRATPAVAPPPLTSTHCS